MWTVLNDIHVCAFFIRIGGKKNIDLLLSTSYVELGLSMSRLFIPVGKSIHDPNWSANYNKQTIDRSRKHPFYVNLGKMSPGINETPWLAFSMCLCWHYESRIHIPIIEVKIDIIYC